LLIERATQWLKWWHHTLSIYHF